MAIGDSSTNFDPDLNARIEQALRGQIVDLSNPLSQIGMALQKGFAAGRGIPDPTEAIVNRQLQLQQAMQHLQGQKVDRLSKGLELLGHLSKSELDDQTFNQLSQSVIDMIGLPKALGVGVSRRRQTMGVAYSPDFLQELGVTPEQVTTTARRGDLEEVHKQLARIAGGKFRQRINEKIQAGIPTENAAEAVLQEHPDYGVFRSELGLTTTQATAAMLDADRKAKLGGNLTALLGPEVGKSLSLDQVAGIYRSKGLDVKDYLPTLFRQAEATAGVVGSAAGEAQMVPGTGQTVAQQKIRQAGQEAFARAQATQAAEPPAVKQKRITDAAAAVLDLKEKGYRAEVMQAATPEERKAHILPPGPERIRGRAMTALGQVARGEEITDQDMATLDVPTLRTLVVNPMGVAETGALSSQPPKPGVAPPSAQEISTQRRQEIEQTNQARDAARALGNMTAIEQAIKQHHLSKADADRLRAQGKALLLPVK